MARGIANNEPTVSQAANEDFRKGYDAAFGDTRPQRGRWVMDPRTKDLVRAEDYVAPPSKSGTSIMCDRWMEGTKTLDDGTDIGSRRKLAAYMREKGVTHAADFSDSWREKVWKERRAEAKRSRREALERAMYRMDKP
jgi:hypothetical protein